jgi:hypothetical protein
VRKLLVPLVAILAATWAVPLTTAGAGQNGNPSVLQVELLSAVEPLSFGLAIDDEYDTCEEGSFAVVEVLTELYETPGSAIPVTPISVTENPTDPNQATMVLPSDTRPGALIVTVQCEGEKNPIRLDGERLWASIPVTKSVAGAVPASAQFGVNVTCVAGSVDDEEIGGRYHGGGVSATAVGGDLDIDLSYGAGGGTKYVYMDRGSDCTVTEPHNGGAASVDITPAQVSTRPAPAAYPVTVANICPEAAVVAQPNFPG